MKLFLLLLLLSVSSVTTLAAPGTKTVRLVISEIDGQPVGTGNIRLAPMSGIRGKVFEIPPQKAANFRVQVVVHRLYDDTWRVIGSSGLFPSGAAGNPARWSVEGVRFPGPDYGQGFEVWAVLVEKSRGELPEGSLDWDTIQQLPYSDPVRGRVQAVPAAPRPLRPLLQPAEPRIRITHVLNVLGMKEPVAPGKTIDVSLLTDVTGYADRPKDSYVYLVAQPMNNEKRWIQDPRGTLHGPYWSDSAYLGRQGDDNQTLFRLQSLLSRVKLKPGPYGEAAWNRIRPALLNVSQEVRVRRRVGPGDLVIEETGNRPAGQGVEVTPECQVSGSIADPEHDHPLQPRETIWLLTRPEGESGWTVAALALPSEDGTSWKIPAARFPKGGKKVTIVAIASLRQELKLGRKLTPSDWYTLVKARRIRRLSNLCSVKTPAVPPSR